MTKHSAVTEAIIGAGIEVHRHLGRGLLESAYQQCLAREFEIREIAFRKELALPVEYKGIHVDSGYRIDFLVEEAVIIEVKAVERILPVHEAQLLTYMRLSNTSIGLLLNFHVPVLKQGIKRFAL